MAGFHHVVHHVLVIERFFNILIDAVKVSIEDPYNVIQLTSNAAA